MFSLPFFYNAKIRNVFELSKFFAKNFSDYFLKNSESQDAAAGTIPLKLHTAEDPSIRVNAVY